jgi:GGDEF domain-containing protein
LTLPRGAGYFALQVFFLLRLRATMPPRTVLILLAVLAASIGFVMERPWPYVAAGALVLGAIGVWGWKQWQARRREDRRARKSSARAAEEEDDEAELESLGIVDIRPREEEEEGASEPARSPEEAEPPEHEVSETKAPETKAPSAQDGGAPPSQKERPEAPQSADASHDAPAQGEEEAGAPPERATPVEATPAEAPFEESDSEKANFEEAPLEKSASEERVAEATPSESPAGDAPTETEEDDETGSAVAPAHGALVRALRLAAGARAACLLAQPEWGLDYRVEATDAEDDAPPLRAAGDSFSTDEPLLSARAARRPVTRHADDDAGSPSTAHYATPPSAPPEAAVLMPVPLPDDPTTRFLVLDGRRDVLDDVPDALLERFAKLFARLLSERPSAPAALAASGGGEPEAAPASVETGPPATPSENGQPGCEPEPARPGEEGGDPRPRGEIIAEKMQQARDEGHALALALVYLNRAEAVAERGEDEVRGAERAFRVRLRRALPEEGERVERFGELTYGVFLRRARAEAERWAVTFQEEMDDARAPLEGGVSIGLAPMRGPEQSPEALRENATHALREAYTTGTCTILE